LWWPGVLSKRQMTTRYEKKRCEDQISHEAPVGEGALDSITCHGTSPFEVGEIAHSTSSAWMPYDKVRVGMRH